MTQGRPLGLSGENSDSAGAKPNGEFAKLPAPADVALACHPKVTSHTAHPIPQDEIDGGCRHPPESRFAMTATQRPSAGRLAPQQAVANGLR